MLAHKQTLSFTVLSCVVAILCGVAMLAGADTRDAAKDYVRTGLAAMGGESQVRAVKTVQFHAIGHRNMLEQSERPEGPYIVEYDDISEVHDVRNGNYSQELDLQVAMQPKFKIKTVVSAGAAMAAFDGQPGPGSAESVRHAMESLGLGPERILITASDAPDLHAELDTVLQAVPHHVIAFTWEQMPVRVFLNADTGLPTAVEWVRAYPYDGFWSIWGDVTTRVYYSFWWLAQGGVHYPLQWDYVRNGLPDHTVTITSLTLNAELPAGSFDIPAEIKSAYSVRANRTVEDRPLGLPNQSGIEIVKDVVHIPGAWNITLVRQTDGVIVIEAPISSGYSAKVMAETERRFPGTPIKAVISTSDSWPHIGGVREYVARGIPVYVLDHTIPLLQRLVATPRTQFPDALAKSPRSPDFRAVSSKTVIGEGPNRLEIYPIRGETSERQMMVYFPEHRLLYGSDPFQKNQDGSYFYPQTVSELMHAVEREKLAVDTFFMMHIGPTPWSELPAAVAKAESPGSGSEK